jgi:hypothetical protein
MALRTHNLKETSTKAAKQFAYAGQIRREALQAGCTSITLISQAAGVLADALSDAGKASGLCRSMAIRWLIGRKTGRNFLTELLGPGQQVNEALVRQMAAEYKQLGATSIDEQTGYIRTKVGEGGLACTGSELASPASGVTSVASWFTQNSGQVGMGKLRSVNTFGGYTHAMGVDLREQYAIFFDPNWGQFTFPTHLKMVNFLSSSMFTRVGSNCYYANAAEYRGALKIGFN